MTLGSGGGDERKLGELKELVREQAATLERFRTLVAELTRRENQYDDLVRDQQRMIGMLESKDAAMQKRVNTQIELTAAYAELAKNLQQIVEQQKTVILDQQKAITNMANPLSAIP